MGNGENILEHPGPRSHEARFRDRRMGRGPGEFSQTKRQGQKGKVTDMGTARSLNIKASWVMNGNMVDMTLRFSRIESWSVFGDGS